MDIDPRWLADDGDGYRPRPRGELDERRRARRDAERRRRRRWLVALGLGLAASCAAAAAAVVVLRSAPSTPAPAAVPAPAAAPEPATPAPAPATPATAPSASPEPATPASAPATPATAPRDPPTPPAAPAPEPPEGAPAATPPVPGPPTLAVFAPRTEGASPAAAAGAGPLAGAVVAIDPGHNPGNSGHLDEIGRLVDAGTLEKPCDTVGTETASGYTEAAHNLDVAYRLKRLLERAGARVVLTHTRTKPAWGPCITGRAEIGNRAGADVAISIHADGHEPTGRGFHVIYPTRVRGLTDDIAKESRRLARLVRNAYAKVTGMPVADYTASRGLHERSDLGGLNLSDVPKVLLEVGNMRDGTDASLLEDPRFRQREAVAVMRAFAAFLAARPGGASA
jgi:N-acetylmuramoyl-L-alanine amidase